MRHYMAAHMHRKLFFAMGVAIFLTLGVAGTVLHITLEHTSFRDNLDSLERHFSGEFARVWNSPPARAAYAQRVAESFHVGLILREAKDGSEHAFGEHCKEESFVFDVRTSGDAPKLGSVAVCASRQAHAERRVFFVGIAAAGLILWIFSGFLARRMGYPLIRLSQVTREIGNGKLSARARLGRHHSGEVGLLAQSINEMAERIEHQLSSQRELLAGVSHEIRTPLARLRVLTEILRDKNVDGKALNDIEREIHELDDLTGQLLASSRLEFEALQQTDVDVVGLCRQQLTRFGLDEELVQVEGKPRPLRGDASLLARACCNLIQNAQGHGQGLTRIRLEFTEHTLQLIVQDKGPGFAPEDLGRIFEPFVRGKNSGRGASSLGLGLSLVARIAKAHSGTARAQNRPEGGAELVLSLRAPAITEAAAPPHAPRS